MFSRTTKGGAAPESASQPRRITVASLVAEGVRISGDLETTGDLHLDGAVDGDIRVGLLTVGETGVVTGAVHADVAEIRGRVTGVICARQVKLWATARVDGDISHAELSIEAGAHFEGRSLVFAAAEGDAVEAPTITAVAAE